MSVMSLRVDIFICLLVTEDKHDGTFTAVRYSQSNTSLSQHSSHSTSQSRELLEHRASETVAPDRRQPSPQPSTCLSKHPPSLRVTSTHLSSPPRSFGCCDSPAAMGASISVQILIVGDFTFNPQPLIRCVTHTPLPDQLQDLD